MSWGGCELASYTTCHDRAQLGWYGMGVVSHTDYVQLVVVVACQRGRPLMRRPVHEGQMPRFLHEKGSRRSKPHAGQRMPAKPSVGSPQLM